jgi:hypothetical protein
VWWNVTVQVSRAAGSTPSWASVQSPANAIVSPPRNFLSAAGWLIVGRGGVFGVVVGVGVGVGPPVVGVGVGVRVTVGVGVGVDVGPGAPKVTRRTWLPSWAA